jgi:hypothetical protein
MKTIIFAIVIAAFLYWYLISRPGKLHFWRAASKYPDAAYDFFLSKKCFKVFEGHLPKNYKDNLPSENWVGPFRLYVPKIGNRIVYVFGKVGEYEQSQDDFLQLLQNSRKVKH